MFLQEPRQLRAELAFFLVGHRRPSRPAELILPLAAKS
jgi:hypothetical protein